MKKKIFGLNFDLKKIPSYESRFNNLGIKMFEAVPTKIEPDTVREGSVLTQGQQFPSLMPEKSLPSRFLRRKGRL